MSLPRQSVAELRVERNAFLSSELRAAIRVVIAAAFPGIDIEDYERRHQDSVALAFVDDRLAGQTAFLARTIEVGGRQLRVAGLGGIATLPEYRGRGIAAQLIEVAVDAVRANDCPTFAFLQCPPDLIPYYEVLGWEHVDVPVFQRNGAELEHVNYPAMVRRLSDEHWPDGAIDFCGLRW